MSIDPILQDCYNSDMWKSLWSYSIIPALISATLLTVDIILQYHFVNFKIKLHASLSIWIIIVYVFVIVFEYFLPVLLSSLKTLKERLFTSVLYAIVSLSIYEFLHSLITQALLLLTNENTYPIRPSFFLDSFSFRNFYLLTDPIPILALTSFLVSLIKVMNLIFLKLRKRRPIWKNKEH